MKRLRSHNGISILMTAMLAVTLLAPAPAPAGSLSAQNSHFKNVREGMQPDATLDSILYVKPAASGSEDCTSWEDACELQDALADAASGEEIWAAAGVYYPGYDSDPRTVAFQLKGGVALYGGFAATETLRTQRDWAANPTILSGDIDHNDVTVGGVVTDTAQINGSNAYHVITAAGITEIARLDGFTITAGNANAPTTPEQWGGGLYTENSDLVIQNVRFEGNSAAGGGGMFSNGGGQPVVLEDVEFSQNTATQNGGGLHTYNGSSPTLTNVTFSDNTASNYGGGMYNHTSSPTLTEVTFSSNTAKNLLGGGMHNTGSSPTLTNVTFSDNTASNYGGGGMSNGEYSSPTLTDVTFSGNHAPTGGGMINLMQSNPTLTNVTFFANSATAGGGMLNSYSSPTLINAIIWGNTPDQIYQEYGVATVTYSDIEGGYSGDGNIDEDPRFVGAPLGNLRLQPGSPAIDAGNNAAVPTGVTTDLDGNPRFVDIPDVSDTGAGEPPIVDMGAYEAQEGFPIIYVDKDTLGPTHDGTSWEYAFTDLQEALVTSYAENEIWVAEGTYYPCKVREENTPFALHDGVAIYGGFAATETLRTQRDWVANPTVLSGDIGVPESIDDNCQTVVASFWVGEATVLDGFTVEKGYSSGWSGGMYTYQSNVQLSNVSFNGNSAESGGGMFIDGGAPMLVNVAFHENSVTINGGGIHTYQGANPTLTNVTFSGNTAGGSGGGMYNLSSSPQIVQSSFYSNTAVVKGGGMYTQGCPEPYPELVNVVFNANQAAGMSGQGGGMYIDNCPTTLTNATLAQNDANNLGGGIYVKGGQLTLNNSLLWGNTANGGITSDDQIHTESGGIVTSNTTIQADESDPSPFTDPAGIDGIPGTPDDDLRPTYPSTYPDGSVIDGGDENSLPLDVFDLDGDDDISEALPVDLGGGPRIYADYNLDGLPDTGTVGSEGYPYRVDRGAYEASGCWAWYMQTGDSYLKKGRAYRLGFHAEIDEPSEVTIAETLSAYAHERAQGNLTKARQSFEFAIDYAATFTQTHQANQGIFDVIWEQATGAMLEANEKMVQALDVTGSPGETVADEISQLIQARDLYDEAVHGYLEPIAKGDIPGLLATLTLTRTHPLTYTTEASLVDLERLVKASAGKSRASLELAERQLRDGQQSQAEGTLQAGSFQAIAEMALLYNLWPEVAETVDYTALLRNLGDMDRLHGYLTTGKNPLGYDPDFIPFRYKADHNNYENNKERADDDLEDAEAAVLAAVNKQQEVDDDYEKMQTNLSAVRGQYDYILIGLCGDGPDLEHCDGGDINTQELNVENAMLQVERVLQQMENQNELIRIEQERVAAEVGIRYATARLITANGEELASLASQEVKIELFKDATAGIFSIISGAIKGASPLGAATPELSVGKRLLGGIVGGATAAFEWQSQNAKAKNLMDIAAAKERLYAKQQAAVQYAEGQIASANSLALQRQYMLKFAELEIDLAIAMNNLQKELAHLVNLRNQAEYALAEKLKAEAFTSLLYRDPAGRVLREEYMELAHYRYERALDSAFKAGKALEYETNEDVTYTGSPLSGLDDLYPLQNVNFLRNALEQMDDAYDEWLDIVGAPQVDTYNYVYLSLAVGFDNDDQSTREEKFNDYIRNVLERVDDDKDGCPEVQFKFQTSIEPGNKLGLSTYDFNDRIKSVQMRVYGTDLFFGVELPTIAGIRLTQGGTSMLRTRFSQIHLGGKDDMRFYNFTPWSITMQAATHDNPLPSQPYIGLFSRGVGATEWTIKIEGGQGATCGDLNLDHIEDIRLYIEHESYPLQGGGLRAESQASPPPRDYQPIRHKLPSLSLTSASNPADILGPAAPSVDNDLNGLFVGTLAITSPLYLPPVELSVQLTDLAGSLSGHISPTLMFPLIPGIDQGPALSGSWSGDSFSFSSLPFVSDLIEGIPITRTLQFTEGIITSTEITRTLSGVYVEILEGITPEPLEMRGVFRMQRPLRPLQAAFSAYPRSVHVGDNVYFSDGSLGTPTSWSWAFGDGSTSTEQNPVHAYAAPGEYTVTLTIGDGASTHTLIETKYIFVMDQSNIYLPLVIR